LATAAPRHTADEEEGLFLRLRRSHDVAARAALDLMNTLERDHDAARKHHAAVDVFGRRWLANGSLTAPDVDRLLTHLHTLQAMYQQHIAIEDRELFPAAGRVLSAPQLAEIGREMAARRHTRSI
jgi:hemerythrin-like domain-containing protein